MSTLNISLWAAQILLAAFFVLGAVIKFMPIAKISAKMPWTGQLPVILVRLLGVLDLVSCAGLISSLFLIQSPLTAWTAICVFAYMLCATIFHVSRGESKVIGANIFALVLAAFIAWGRF